MSDFQTVFFCLLDKWCLNAYFVKIRACTHAREPEKCVCATKPARAHFLVFKPHAFVRNPKGVKILPEEPKGKISNSGVEVRLGF